MRLWLCRGLCRGREEDRDEERDDGDDDEEFDEGEGWRMGGIGASTHTGRVTQHDKCPFQTGRGCR